MEKSVSGYITLISMSLGESRMTTLLVTGTRKRGDRVVSPTKKGNSANGTMDIRPLVAAQA